MKFWNLKRIVFCILLTTPFYNVSAQELRGFGNYSMYLGTGSSESVKEMEAGIDIGDFPSIAIQLSLSYFTLKNKEQENYDYDNYVLEKQSAKGYAVNTGLGLKLYNLFLDDYLGGEFNYFIMPKLNLARIQATENFSSSDYFNPSNSFIQKRSLPAWQVYGSVEIGYEFFLSENNSNSIVVSAIYNRLNLGKGLNKMPYNNVDYSRPDNFGLGISFYLGIKKPFSFK